MDNNNQQIPYEILESDSLFDYNFKVIVIGNSQVGKSALAFRVTKDQFLNETLPTIGYDHFEFGIKIKDALSKESTLVKEHIDYQLPESAKNRTIKLSIWDTCGQERYRSLVTNFFHSSSLAIIVYSIDDYNSFSSIESWIKQVNTLAGINCKIILIGNKADVNEDLRKVSFQEGQDLALNNNIALFLETSARDGQNVKELFVHSAYVLYYDYLKSNSQKVIDEDMVKELMLSFSSCNDKNKACCWN